MENTKTKSENQKVYLVLNRQQLLNMWKYANKKSIMEYGKKELKTTIIIHTEITPNGRVNDREQICSYDMKYR